MTDYSFYPIKMVIHEFLKQLLKTANISSECLVCELLLKRTLGVLYPRIKQSHGGLFYMYED